MEAARTYDIVLFGGTGFTGGLTAEYLAANASATTKWALAGRNMDKLEQLRDRLGVDVPLVKADVTDKDSIDAVAASTRVVITTVGPYIEYGEPLVRACAENGTDYTDLTGEPEFVDRMYLKYNELAETTGARLVHACGFDSIPHDLGVLFTVEQLPEGVPLKVRGVVQSNGSPSGGTVASAMTAFSRLRENMQAAKQRKQAEQHANGRVAKAEMGKPHREAEMGAWVLPMPTIDPQVIVRSARALERYGPDFTYGHYIAVKNLPQAVGLPLAVGGIFGIAQVGPARRWLMGRLPAGTGPSAEKREQAWFRVRFTGEGGGKRVVTQVAGGDPGYTETSKMLAESALCLAHDDLPQTAGQVTTAQAMGDTLIARLKRAGMTFEVLEAS
ncbi:MAG: hypothetical protein QOJ29_1470 [Thermoleophilaceae bacterium]|jgi:short subunit dehydrogenase-like uncharacterized protein|nr:hypothetical protein [Thermoleophilaceae bacterium]